MADEELAEAVVTEEVPAEAEELTAELPEEGADGEQSKTLLSGDEGEGEGVVPEKYAFEPPEGVEVDQSKIDVFGETAKEMGLTQAQFQQLVEYDI